jgi:hypothetical protein
VEQSGKIPKTDQMAVGQLIMLAAAQVLPPVAST